MTKTEKTVCRVLIFSILLFIGFSSSPVKAETKRVRVAGLKACARESTALPAVLEEFRKAEKRTGLLRQKAVKLYNKIIQQKKKLAHIPIETQEDVDRHNAIVQKINTQVDRQKKAVDIYNRAVAGLNIFRGKIKKRQTDYTDNCQNIHYRRKHILIVCRQEEFKSTSFCKQR